VSPAIFFFLSFLMVAAGPAAQACTLFAAAGDQVAGGGALIGKNRDRDPQASALKVCTPKGGYRHLALVAAANPREAAVAGVNEKGLVVVDARASCLPAAQQQKCGAVALTQALLSRCASVDEVLAQKDLLTASYPVFEMVADLHKVAWIEVAPGGLVASRVRGRGALGHTNHYLDPDLGWANLRATPGSRVRLRRITRLLTDQEAASKKFTFADFLVFSQDRHDGPDRSINRFGSTPGETRTLATFVVQLSGAAPHVFVRLNNPGEPERIVNFILEPGLWTKGLREKVL
jgi:isopenicillin-N N-acyltransferase like protein